ncbi:hypothetical protein [Sulfurisphaera tokodaii]|uniref:Uncharacterized protein n=2 Tax=Sulfurisphaera tokodaii TaxID=111955 RepID=Q970H5_SULTO|nr:hypothetical protein [Sulfurisphaera tokodaii]BAB66698.1 hypothetical protein STK_16200 [Sulfurisphaera tokodaii str. 7]HII73481.1 hypothetical protein [Sulfurisphaera tokodaii]
MDKNWFSTPQEIREGIKYLSAHFYPASIMDRWKILKKLSFEKAKIIANYSLQQVIEEIEHFDFFNEYFKEDPLTTVRLPPSYIKLFDGLVEDFQSSRWRENIATRFHMITEGVLATVGLKILNETSRKYNLLKFNEGIKRIIEDEARHVSFGLSLIEDKEYAVKRVEELFPLAVQIVKEGKDKIEPLGYSIQELVNLMEELKKARINKILGS